MMGGEGERNMWVFVRQNKAVDRRPRDPLCISLSRWCCEPLPPQDICNRCSRLDRSDARPGWFGSSRSSVFGEKNKSSVTVGDSKEGPAPRDGHPSKSVSSSSGVGGGGYEGAMVALRRRSPVHSDVRAGNGHGHGYGHGSIHSERDRERVREGRGAVGDDHDKRGGGGGSSSTQDRRRREDAGDRSPKKRAAATVASMAVSGGGGRSGRGGSGSGGHVGSEGGLSPERRSLPPKKDIQRRDSPPTPES